jgi:hypothetical protein
METALSLKNGAYISATGSNHKATKSLLLVCPECGEPVFFKMRKIPNRTSFYSHHKEIEALRHFYSCSLRTENSELGLASVLVPGISHGQLVDKFQKYFCKGIVESFGEYSTILIEFIKHSQFERLDKKTYRNFINYISNNFPSNKILISTPNNFNNTDFKTSINDICRFLNSQFGIWVGNFIYQTAYFIAVTLQHEILNKNLGSKIYEIKNKNILFIADNKRLNKINQYAGEILPSENERNLSIDKISATLISYLVLKWTFNEQLLPNLYISVNEFNFKNKIKEKYLITYPENTNELEIPKETKKYVISSEEIRRNNPHLHKEISLYRWYKIDDGIGDKKSDLFINFESLLRDMIPHKGWTDRQTSIFIKETNVESPIFHNLKAIVSCPDCGTKCRVGKLKKISITCPKCSCTWKQRLY